MKIAPPLHAHHSLPCISANSMPRFARREAVLELAVQRVWPGHWVHAVIVCMMPVLAVRYFRFRCQRK